MLLPENMGYKTNISGPGMAYPTRYLYWKTWRFPKFHKLLSLFFIYWLTTITIGQEPITEEATWFQDIKKKICNWPGNLHAPDKLS